MQVNESIYGLKSDWVNPYGDGVENPPLLANFGDNKTTLKDGNAAGKTPINTPIDNSVCFLGVDKNCWLTQLKFVKFPDKNTIIEVGFKDTNLDYYPVFFTGGNDSFSTDSVNLDLRNDSARRNSGWGYKMLEDVTNVNNNNVNRNITIFTKIPTNIVYTIFVTVSATPDGQSYIYSLDEYTSKYFNTNPYIRSVGYTTYIKKSDSDTRQYIDPPRPTIYSELQPIQYTEEIEMTILRYTGLKSYYGIYSNTTQKGVLILGTFSSNAIQNTNMYYLNSKENSTIYLTGGERYCNFIWELSDFGGIVNFKEFCLKQISYLGGFFTTDPTKAQTLALDDDDMYLGIIDENGITHGVYTNGSENRSQRQWDWEDLSQSEFNPNSKPESPDTEQASTPYTYNTVSYNGLECGNYYALSLNDLQNFRKWCESVACPSGPFAPYGEKVGDGQYSYEEFARDLSRLFNGSYPIDNIINLMYFPFDIPSKIYGAGAFPIEAIKIGNASTDSIENFYGSDIQAATGVPLKNGAQYAILKTEPYLIDNYFNDFRDYSPYTTMSLTVPFHGTLDISPDIWYGHYISTVMIVDVTTGTSTTVIERDSIPVASIDGQAGVPVQLIARNVSDFVNTTIQGSQSINQTKNSIYSTYIGTVTNAGLMTAGAVSGNFPLAFSSAMSIFSSAYNAATMQNQISATTFDIQHTKPTTTVLSTQSPSVSLYLETSLRLNINRPHLMDGYNSGIYGKTVGFACCINGYVENFTGYTVCSNILLENISATEYEKNMILSHFKSGVIL